MGLKSDLQYMWTNLKVFFQKACIVFKIEDSNIFWRREGVKKNCQQDLTLPNQNFKKWNSGLLLIIIKDFRDHFLYGNGQ